MSILNLTQHPATAEQRAAGVIDLPEEARECLHALLAFDEMPDAETITARAAGIAELAASLASAEDRDDGTVGFALHAMIDGEPWLMAPLERALREQGIEPVHASTIGREFVPAGPTP